MRYAAKWLGLVAVTAVTVPVSIDAAQLDIDNVELRIVPAPAICDHIGAKIPFCPEMSREELQDLDSESLLKNLQTARSQNDQFSEAELLNQLGILSIREEDFEQASIYHLDALKIFSDLRQETKIKESISLTVNAYIHLEDYVAILSFLKDILSISSPINSQALHSGAERFSEEFYKINNYSANYYFDALYWKAVSVNGLNSWEEAIHILKIFYFLEDRFLGRIRPFTLERLGISSYYSGNYKDALDFHQQAFESSFERVEFGREDLVVHENAEDFRAMQANHMAFVHRALGEYKEALEILDRVSIDYPCPDGACRAHAYSLGYKGIVLSEIGQCHEALEYLESAKEYRGRLEDDYWWEPASEIMLAFPKAYSCLSEHELSNQYFQEILARGHGIPGAVLPEQRAFIYDSLAKNYIDLKDYKKSIDYGMQALDIHRRYLNREGEANSLAALGLALERQGNLELAIIFYKTSVNTWEGIRSNIRNLPISTQRAYTERISGSYRLLADLLLQQNRILEAQRVLDLLKVQELDDALRGVRSTSDTSGGVAFWQMESDLLALYNQVLADDDELAQLQAADYDSLSPDQQQRLTTLRQRNADVQSRFITFLDRPEVRQLLAQIRQDTEGQNLEIERQHRALQNNLRALPQKTALLYPLILPDRLELVVVTADGPPLRYPIAVTGTELNRAIVAFGQALKDPSSDIQPLAQQLYTWLVAPLEAQLAQIGVESLLYAPDGALRYVPLSALHDGEQYLAERFSISHITAASLTNFDRRPEGQRRLLAAACAECSFTVNVGDRAFVFADLPYTETEVNGLAKQVPNTSVLLNQAFSREGLENRLGNYSIIHLATHGAVVENQPSQSFLVLGSGETVTLETIRNSWSLSHAELVVLSACETAVGSPELGSGVEILGLGHQIQEAGAQGVLASLWKVSDQGTQVLMTAFYDALGQGMTKTEALQAAQNALITGDFSVVGGQRAGIDVVSSQTGQPLVGGSLAHPYYWAPFILIGNGL